MSVNKRRGEVAAELDGAEWRLCLTLNALAELEDAFAADNLNELVARFGSGALSARDIRRILGAGLRGGGGSVTDEEAGAMRCADGATGAARIVAELLEATFGGGGGAGANPPPPQDAGRAAPSSPGTR